MVKLNRESSFSYVQDCIMPTGPKYMCLLNGLLKIFFPKNIQNDIGHLEARKAVQVKMTLLNLGRTAWWQKAWILKSNYLGFCLRSDCKILCKSLQRPSSNKQITTLAWQGWYED